MSNPSRVDLEELRDTLLNGLPLDDEFVHKQERYREHFLAKSAPGRNDKGIEDNYPQVLVFLLAGVHLNEFVLEVEGFPRLEVL